MSESINEKYFKSGISSEYIYVIKADFDDKHNVYTASSFVRVDEYSIEYYKDTNLTIDIDLSSDIEITREEFREKFNDFLHRKPLLDLLKLKVLRRVEGVLIEIKSINYYDRLRSN